MTIIINNNGCFIKKTGMSKSEAREYNQQGFKFYGFEDTKRGYVAMFQKQLDEEYDDLRILVNNLIAGDLPRYIELGLTQSD